MQPTHTTPNRSLVFGDLALTGALMGYVTAIASGIFALIVSMVVAMVRGGELNESVSFNTYFFILWFLFNIPSFWLLVLAKLSGAPVVNTFSAICTFEYVISGFLYLYKIAYLLIGEGNATPEELSLFFSYGSAVLLFYHMCVALVFYKQVRWWDVSSILSMAGSLLVLHLK